MISDHALPVIIGCSSCLFKQMIKPCRGRHGPVNMRETLPLGPWGQGSSLGCRCNLAGSPVEAIPDF